MIRATNIKIGFTGTQKGMTAKQQESLKKLFKHILQKRSISEFHHGDCIGADEQAHKIVFSFCKSIHIHPGTDSRGNSPKRAFCTGRVYDPAPYLIRNKIIVDSTDLLIACPHQSFEEIRSGTWATVRYALKAHKHLIIVYPSGIIQ